MKKLRKYFEKHFRNHKVDNVHRALENLTNRRERAELQRKLQKRNEELVQENTTLKNSRTSQLDGFIGFHPSIMEIKEMATMYANTNQPVLITGETGTGKELLARAIHNLSHRKDKPFIALNCSAFSDGLIESELFGYEKGSFTGAVTSKIGLAKAADGGALF